MIQYKKIIMTLVALFAMTAGAWAQDIATPVISGETEFYDEVTVTITCATPEVDIYYTLDGSNPKDDSSSSTQKEYKNAFTLTETTTVRAAAYSGDAWSAIAEVTFTKQTGPKVTWDAATKTGTFTMPAGNVELQVEYYPGMLVKPTNLVGGTLEVVGLGLGTTSFTAPSGWNHNSTRLASSHFEGFKGVTEEEAKAWPGVPATGLVALYYNYDETAQKWDMIYFKDGAFDAIYKGVYQQLATIYNLPGFGYSVFYTTGMQMPAGFEKDDDGNIYVKKDTKFTVKAVPAEGYHLVGWSDDATNKELEREFTMGDDDFILTATFSDEYDLAFEAANANTIEAGKATVKVGDTDKTADIQDGKLSGVKYGQTVTIKAKNGYKFKKVEAKKGAAAAAAKTITIGDMELTYADGDTWETIVSKNSDKIKTLAGGYIVQVAQPEPNKYRYIKVVLSNKVNPSDIIDPSKNYEWGTIEVYS